MDKLFDLSAAVLKRGNNFPGKSKKVGLMVCPIIMLLAPSEFIICFVNKIRCDSMFII